MFEDPQLDPLGALVSELRADSDVEDLVDDRVRGFEPAPGDAQNSGDYQAFIVISALDVTPHPRVPATFALYDIACYGVTGQNAWAVYGAVAKALHAVGSRMKANGLGIYRTFVLSGGDQDRDPDTRQPVVRATVRLIGTTQAVPA